MVYIFNVYVESKHSLAQMLSHIPSKLFLGIHTRVLNYILSSHMCEFFITDRTFFPFLISWSRNMYWNNLFLIVRNKVWFITDVHVYKYMTWCSTFSPLLKFYILLLNTSKCICFLTYNKWIYICNQEEMLYKRIYNLVEFNFHSCYLYMCACLKRKWY